MPTPELLSSRRNEQGAITEYYRGYQPAEELEAERATWTSTGFQGQETIVDRGFLPPAVATVLVLAETQLDEESAE